MTTLRETLARAIDPLAFAMNDYIEAGIHKRAKARSAASIVLRALATWEPSDAVTDAMWHAYNGHDHAGDLAYTLTAAMRKMAEEGT